MYLFVYTCMHTYIHKIKIKGKEPIYLKVGQGGVLAEREWKVKSRWHKAVITSRLCRLLLTGAKRKQPILPGVEKEHRARFP